ncbi:MDR family MFS transporter [Nocardiopsis baichengensis]|uniref:MDR family MFS transporter n=1 Tax=Nocardiopsis baichengensis TaxID=280240 RepID=UPI00034BFD1A|nr:MDR family MFS transporter [Nocardiopsis baichengensis]
MSPSPPPAASEGAAAATSAESTAPRTGPVIGLLVASAFVVILNETIMSVAMPRLMVDLDITAATAQWLTTAFMLTMAAVIPMTGRLLERYTTRTLFIAAMSLFSAGTLLAAAAPGFGALLAGRVVQASGTAVMMPLLMTTVLTFVPAERRGRTMGLISIVMAVAPAIGPTVSGLVLSVLGWRWMFIVVLPFALLALGAGAVLVRNVSRPRPVRFDLLSVALSAVAFGGLIYGLNSIGEAAEGHAAVSPLLPIAVGAVVLAVFVVRQVALQRQDRPLMDLRAFRTRNFTVALVLVLISMAALFGALITLPLLLQNVLGYGTLETGLMLLPGGLVMGLVGAVIGRVFDRVGPRPLVTPGAVAVSAALWGMTALDQDATPALIIGVHLVLNVGLGFMLTPLLTSALGSLPAHLYTHGSAILNTLQQVAAAAGTALFITVMSTGAAAAVASGEGAVAAQAQGLRTAFVCGAVISLFAVAMAWLVKRPADHGGTAADGPAPEAGTADAEAPVRAG